MVETLTHAVVEGLTCPLGRKDIVVFDDDVSGFAVRVTKAGTKVFLVQYVASGTKRRARIGLFGTITVAVARREAKALLGAVARGEDPFATRRALTKAAQTAKAGAAFTFGHMVHAWAKARSADRRGSYIVEAVRCLNRNLQWTDRAAASITVPEAVAALDAVKARVGIVAANRTKAYASAVYGWALRRQQVAVNPFAGVEQPGREEARERVLTAEELGAIWRACDTLSPTLAGFARVLLLTLQRRQEVASMRWSELDDAAAVWTLPGKQAKNARSHIVHLSAPVRSIVQALPKIHGNPYVFAGLNGKPIAAFNYAKAQIEKAVPQIPDWRFHDFRRSGVTILANLDFPPHVCDRILNHVGGTLSAIARVYQKAEFLNERKAALDAWAAYVLSAVETNALAKAA